MAASVMTSLGAALVTGGLVGVGATATLDAWNALLARTLGVASLDLCLLGRWVGHLRRGVVRHQRIATSSPIRLECAIGWMAHYGIGIGLAGAFVLAFPGWLAHPTPGPALAYGLVTVALPFLVLQPALGLGIASSAAPRPWRARGKSLATHAVFGLGLYAWAWVVQRLG